KLLAWATKHSQTESERRRLERWEAQHAQLIGYVKENQRELFEHEEEIIEKEDVITLDMLEEIDELNRTEYRVEEILAETFLDLDQVAEFLEELQRFEPKHDDKLQGLIKLLKAEPVLKKHKVLIFSEYMATARYLKKELTKAGLDDVDEVDSAVNRDRGEIIRQFSPYYNGTTSGRL